MRTLCMTLPGGSIASFILRSSTFDVLKSQPNLRIVLLTPLIQDEEFVKEFASERVIIEDLPLHQPSWGESLALRLARESFVRKTDASTIQIRLAAAASARSRNPLRRIAGLTIKLLRYLPPAFWYRVGDLFVREDLIRSIFIRYAPDLVVSMKGGLQLWEVPVLKEARQRRISTAVIGLSWDNLTTKLLPLRPADHLIVWNNQMKYEAMSIQGYREDQVSVCGIPHFDYYHDTTRRTPREVFFRRLGLDPSQRLIVVATNHDHASRECRMEGLVESLYEAAQKGNFGGPVQVLVRLHPRDEPAPYHSLGNRPGLVIEKPFHSWTMCGRKEVCYDQEDFLHLADTLYHADVLVNVFSTIMIEACIFDKPVINAAFDNDVERPYLFSARRFTGYTHIKRIIDTGGVRVAHTLDELIALVRFALEHPDVDREGRRRIVEENCYRVDGRSGERQAHLILRCLERAAPQP